MADDTRANLTKGSTWTRLIYIVLFTVTFNVAEVVIAVITLIQFFTALFTGGKPNERLRELGGMMATYVREVVAFLTYETDDKPFPIGEWPQATSGKSKVVKKSKPAKT